MAEVIAEIRAGRCRAAAGRPKSAAPHRAE